MENIYLFGPWVTQQCTAIQYITISLFITRSRIPMLYAKGEIKIVYIRANSANILVSRAFVGKTLQIIFTLHVINSNISPSKMSWENSFYIYSDMSVIFI